MLKSSIKKIISLVVVAQLLLSTAFATSYMKLGRTASDLSANDGSTFLQKAYCTVWNNYYVNVNADSNKTMRLSMVMRYLSGDTTIVTWNFSYTSYAWWSPMANTPRLVTTWDAWYNSLEGGYPYIKMEDSTTSNFHYLGTWLINFANFNFINNFWISLSNLKFHYNVSNPTINASSIVGVKWWSNTLASDYLVDVKFIPEPCSPDVERPIFIGTTVADTWDFMPGSASQRADLFAWVKFGITEPYGANASWENYAYTGWSPKTNTVVDPLDTTYIFTGTTDQWGINTWSVKITLTYTWVASGTMDQRGTWIAITKIFSWSDLVFLSRTGANWDVRTWNRNYEGFFVSVDQSILDAMPQFRKETQASITFTGQDRANSLPYIINLSGTARDGANVVSNTIAGMTTIGWQYGYTFNSWTDNTPLSWFGAYSDSDFSNSNPTPGNSSRISNINQQISWSHNNLYFKFTDNRAGIATGSITLQVDVFTATNTVSGSYETVYTSPDDTYAFSWSDLNLFGFAGNADYDDYTWYINLSSWSINLATWDRVRIVLYGQDYVGNSVTKTGWFDMQDYPPKPNTFTITLQLENHLPITYDKITSVVGRYFTPSPLTTTLAAYYSWYDSLSGFTYLGLTTAELTWINAGSTLTGVFLANGILTGYANIDTWLSVTKSYTFTWIAHNVYNQTWLLIININVEPGCSDAEGCGPKMRIYTGNTLAEAQSSLTGTRYNHRFLRVRASDRPTLTGTSSAAILYCAWSGAIANVDIMNLDWYSNAPYNTEYHFSGTTLFVSGDNTYNLSGVIYLNNNIYIFRDLTGGIEYVTGKYIAYPQINWTRDAIITGTITITWGYITGDNAWIFSGPVIELGWGRRVYTYASDITWFDILIENRWNDASGWTVDPAYYQTWIVRFNNSWIDLTPPDMTGGNSCQSPHIGTIILESQLTWYGENFTGNLTYLTWDDDTFIITAITTGAAFTSFGDNQGSWIVLYDIDANSWTYVLSWAITFTDNRSGYIHFYDRAGNTWSIFIETTCIQWVQTTVYAIPGYRDVDNYAFTGTVSIFTLSWWEGTFYSSYTGAFSNTGIGQFVLDKPLYGQSIGVVLQSTMHLPAMWFTGTLTETGTNFFDFTVWTGRGIEYTTSGWFDYVDLWAIWIRSLLVPWDVFKSDNVGTGSIINAFDMERINENLTLSDADKHPEYDFDDKDGIISSFEQAVIIQNLQRQGWDLDLDKFGGLIYTWF